MKPTDWLPLFDGDGLTKWAINGLNHLEIDGDALVVHPDPKGEGVRAEVGGASWDNYVLSAEAATLTTASNSPPAARRSIANSSPGRSSWPTTPTCRKTIQRASPTSRKSKSRSRRKLGSTSVTTA